MKYLVMYAAMIYIVACADAVEDGDPMWNRIVQALLWPITVSVWFTNQGQRLHRMLNILWCVLIAGWFLSLLADRL